MKNASDEAYNSTTERTKFEKNIEALQHNKKGDASDRKILQRAVVE